MALIQYFWYTRLEILTPAQHVVHMTNIKYDNVGHSHHQHPRHAHHHHARHQSHDNHDHQSHDDHDHVGDDDHTFRGQGWRAVQYDGRLQKNYDLYHLIHWFII